MNDGHVNISYQQFTRDDIHTVQSNIAVEAPVTLTVNGQVWLTFQCTPLELDSLAVGFLYNEGFIRTLAEIEDIHICDQKDNVDIWLNHPVQKPATWRRTAGCHGGTSSVDQEPNDFIPITNIVSLRTEIIFSLIDQFMNDQISHLESGGVHTSALADGSKQLFQIQDIGRHNTFDKIAGKILLNKLEVTLPVLITSGRVSSDMLLKSVRLRAPFLISMRSTSQLGINMADQLGVTLIGGARRGRFFLYSHPEGIQTK